MSKLTTAITVSGVLTVTLSLAACSGSEPMGGMEHGSSASAEASTQFNDQDVMFAQMMIPHHEQAVEMATMILAKDGIDPAVTDLAVRIQAAQGPEIDTMNSWLAEWGADSGMSGMNHGSDGMLTDPDMVALGTATGSEAARLFLEGMVSHHEGAIVMAQDEVDTGGNGEAIALAKTIVQDQTAEITEMKDLLAGL